MIPKEEVLEVLNEYETLRVATIASHSALQIFYGAKKEGFETVAIVEEGREKLYSYFPLAKPDHTVVVENHSKLIEIQEKLRELNCILIPHGSFVAYLGKKIEQIYLPIFGNREALMWEMDREKQEKWMKEAGIKFPKRIREPNDENQVVFVKFHGARGGSGYRVMRAGDVKCWDGVFVQEFVAGVRYYPHFFYSPILKRNELLGMDKRIETIDESYRALGMKIDDFLDYTVSGNLPLVLRESFLTQVIEMAERILEASRKLFPPGIIGPYCLELAYNPKKGFYCFEISSRIVAGTNLYVHGSPYSFFYFPEPMCMGQRICREIRNAKEQGKLAKLIW